MTRKTAATLFAIAALPLSCVTPALAGSSAIGDLENITGQTIERPTVSSMPMPTRVPTKTTTVVKSSPGISSSTMAAITTSMMVIDMLNAMNASQAQAQAAQAMAEAEQSRIKEEQRKQRLISAAHLRSFWDGSDEALSENLDDVFSLPGQVRGTNFFGTQPTPSAALGDDANLSDIVAPAGISTPTLSTQPTSSATPAPSSASKPKASPTNTVPTKAKPQLIGSGAPTGPSSAVPEFAETSSIEDGILKSGANYAQDYATSKAKDVIKEIIKSALPTSAHNAELMVEHLDKMNDFTNDLFKALDPKNLVHTITNGSPDDYQNTMNALDRVTRKGSELGLGDSPLNDTELEAGQKFFNGEDLSPAAQHEIIVSRCKGYFSKMFENSLTKGKI